MKFTLLSWGRVYPSAATARIGPDHVRRAETICTTKSEATGLVAVCIAPPTPKTPPVVATAKVGRDNFWSGGGAFSRKTADRATCIIALFGPRMTPMAVTPPDGFDAVLRLKRNAGLQGDQGKSRGPAGPCQQENGSESESPQGHPAASFESTTVKRRAGRESSSRLICL
jgi:hypothetical protein